MTQLYMTVLSSCVSHVRFLSGLQVAREVHVPALRGAVEPLANSRLALGIQSICKCVRMSGSKTSFIARCKERLVTKPCVGACRTSNFESVTYEAISSLCMLYSQQGSCMALASLPRRCKAFNTTLHVPCCMRIDAIAPLMPLLR